MTKNLAESVSEAAAFHVKFVVMPETLLTKLASTVSILAARVI